MNKHSIQDHTANPNNHSHGSGVNWAAQVTGRAKTRARAPGGGRASDVLLTPVFCGYHLGYEFGWIPTEHVLGEYHSYAGCLAAVVEPRIALDSET